jgi:hypothetical protein
VLRGVARLPWATFGYYSRPAVLVAATGPFGIGYDVAKAGLRNAWVSMNANAAEVSLRNLSDKEVPVELGFDAAPGPGIAGVDLTIACDNKACAPQHLIPNSPPPWHLRVPLKLSPGITAVRFTAAAQQTGSLDQQAAAPLAIIGHLHLIWNDR